MTLFEMSFCAASHNPIPRSYTNPIPIVSKILPKFQVGDFVRVPDKRSVYSYTTNWNRELFKIGKINSTNPVTYTLEDENGEIIQGNTMNKNF